MARGSWIGLALGACLVLVVLLVARQEAKAPPGRTPVDHPLTPAGQVGTPAAERPPQPHPQPPSSLRVELPPAPLDTSPVALPRSAPAEVFGALSDEQGRPLADVLVRLRGAHGGHHTRSAADGSFVFPGLAAGEYLLWAHSTAHCVGDTLRLAVGEGVRLGPLSLSLAAGLVAAGRVVDGLSGAGIEGALLRGQLEQQGPFRQTRSLADGTFVLQGLQAGRWWLSCQAPGYLSAHRWQVVPGAEVPHFALQPGSWLEGQVLDPAGLPLVGALVEVLAIDAGSPLQCISDARGGYATPAMPTGRYLIRASHPQGGLQAQEEVELSAAGVQRRDLHLLAGGSLSGSVQDSRGAPVAGAQVYLLGAGGQRRLPSAADGSFRFQQLAPAEYLLLAVTEQASSEQVAAWPQDPPVSLSLQAGFSLRGQVLSAAGDPCEALVSAWPEDGHELLQRHVLSGPDGRFLLQGLSAGDHTIAAEGLGESVSQTGTAVRGDGELALRLLPESSLPGRVQGQPTSPLAAVEVSLLPARGFARLALLDAEGFFVIEGLHPGQYEARLLGEPAASVGLFSVPAADSIFLQLGD